MARGGSGEVRLKGRSFFPLHILSGRMETAVPCEMEPWLFPLRLVGFFFPRFASVLAFSAGRTYPFVVLVVVY